MTGLYDSRNDHASHNVYDRWDSHDNHDIHKSCDVCNDHDGYDSHNDHNGYDGYNSKDIRNRYDGRNNLGGHNGYNGFITWTLEYSAGFVFLAFGISCGGELLRIMAGFIKSLIPANYPTLQISSFLHSVFHAGKSFTYQCSRI